jgi:hypothetical protein
MEQFYTGDPVSRQPIEDKVIRPTVPHAETKIVTIEELGERGYPLTPEEARVVPLSWNPVHRLGQLAAYGKPFCTIQTGWSPLPQYTFRGDLVRAAISRAEAEKMWAIVNEARERNKK